VGRYERKGQKKQHGIQVAKLSTFMALSSVSAPERKDELNKFP